LAIPVVLPAYFLLESYTNSKSYLLNQLLKPEPDSIDGKMVNLVLKPAIFESFRKPWDF
jgi:hypothetical protein